MNTYKMTLEDSVDSMTFDLLEVPIVDKDVEGAVDNTTLDGNVFTDYLWLKKNYVQKWSIMCDDEYSRLRGFYTRQFDNASVPTYKLFYGENISEDRAISGDYILVDNTTEKNAPITSFELLGDAEQDGTPTPDAPQAVNTVTGEQTVKIQGKNLLPDTWAQDFVDAVNSTSLASTETKDGRRCLTYQPSAGYGSYPTKNFTLGVTFKENTQYTFSFDYYRDTSSNRTVAIFYTDGTNSTFPQLAPDTWHHVVMTSTAGKTVAYIAPYYTNGTSWIDIDTAQLELGSTATAYEPYQGQTLPVNLGKNLLNPTELPKTQVGVTGTYQDGIFSLSGTASVASNFYILPYATGIAHLEAGESLTYYIERVSGSVKVRFLTYFVPDDGSTMDTTWRVDLDAGASSNTVVKTATKAGTVQYVQFFLESGVTYDSQVKVLVQRGNIANPTWSPYFTPIELAKIGDYQDKIYKDDGKWYIEKQVGKVVWDGSETTWNRSQSTTTGLYAYWIVTPSSYLPGWIATDEALKLCDRFTYKYQEWKTVTSPCLCESSGLSTNMCIFSGFADITTVADWKTWLTSNPTTVYYALATPTTTEITNSELVEQLETILQAYLYTGTNNVSNNAVSPNLAGQMNIGYKLIFSEETVLIEPTAVRLTLTDGGIINVCGCRQNVQLTMRETIQ